MLNGKRGVVLGVANKRSLAWAIARSCAAHGAELAITYQGPRFEEGTRNLAASLEGIPPLLLPCNVTVDDEIEALADAVQDAWGTVDFVVHSVAFANPDELRTRFHNTSREGFAQALDISAFSLIPLARAMAPLMPSGGSMLALSYLGGERVVPGYNVMGVAKAALDSAVRYLAHDLGPMGIRVNAIAPGPVKTVSASGIGDFNTMLAHHKAVAPMRLNVTQDDVADVALFFLSDLSRTVTGAHLPVDGGYSIMGVASAEEMRSN